MKMHIRSRGKAGMLAALALLLMFHILSVTATEVQMKPASPRLWEVTSNNADGSTGKFYVLAITHNGLDVEYDDYLDAKVVPAFLASDILSYENAQLSPFSIKPCSNPWPHNKENAELLQMARSRARLLMMRSMHFSAESSAPFTGKDIEQNVEAVVDSLSEYGLIAYLASFRAKDSLENQGPSLGRGQITAYLIGKNKKVKTESVDTTDEFVSAYCRTNHYRPEYFRRSVRSARFDQIPPMTQKYIHASNQSFSDSIKRETLVGLLKARNADEEKAIICERTANWLPKMTENMQKGVAFYALGVAHLFPSAAGNAHCQGLLNDLRERGMTVRLVP